MITVDLAPTLLDVAGVDAAAVAARFPDLVGRSLLPALSGRPVPDGVLAAVEIVSRPTWRGDAA
ncbi:MAG TPA: hypothetical protein VGH76_17500 [Actinomycetospora sp.]